MDGLSISQVAERTGFSTSTLRFYERAGLLAPDRTPAGYRCYGRRDLDQLALIARAKGLGLTLEEIGELLVLGAGDRCAPVQERLHALVVAKGEAAEREADALAAFADDLRRAATDLAAASPDGPCDGACACVATPGARPTPAADGATAPIACTLDLVDVPDRIGAWRAALAHATGHEPIGGGVAVRLGPASDLGALTALADAERSCCAFLTFRLVLDGDGTTFEVTGPDAARPVIDALVHGVG